MFQKPRYTVYAHINIWTLQTFQDKEEIKKLSPSEQKKRLGEIVNKIDADGDKYLSTGKCTVVSCVCLFPLYLFSPTFQCCKITYPVTWNL